ncbi:MAG: class I SAM-dependent methyltransferase [Lachnospiraceae bacterium]|nr:class I SAM-dependent methyltransferase [Lachnospiraceae bacterium]
MQEKIGNIVIDDSFYSGDDLYTDGSIEDRILEICKSGKEKEVLHMSNEWPILYHLSDIRENLLEWYPFTKQDDVLEIGSGCGAMTGLLSKKAGSVTCVELSRKRSLINAYRNRDCNNVTILIGNFEDIKLQCRYDYITLIGVWEYSGLYIQGANPYLAMIEKLKTFLKPQGKIIIAIENKMGLKYWNGAPEDHTCRLYSGLNDYIGEKNVRTFSRQEIMALLKEAGFEQLSFYYPMPDYKLPDTIYSDGMLPETGEVRYYRSDYSTYRIYNFYDATTYDQICKDNMFPYFANSFLVVCGGKQQELCEFAKYCRERRNQFRISTEIRNVAGKKYVVKKALCKEAIKHVLEMKRMETKWNGILSNVLCLEGRLEGDEYILPYTEGIDLDAYFYTWRNDSEQFIKQVEKVIKEYLTPNEQDFMDFTVTREYEEIFGDNYPPKAKSLRVTNVDCLFSNLRKMADGRICSFDYEWIFEFPVPYKFVLWRALTQLYGKYMIYLKTQISKNEFLARFEIDTESAAVFEKMNQKFSYYAHGENDKEKYLVNYKKAAFMQDIRWV